MAWTIRSFVSPLGYPLERDPARLALWVQLHGISDRQKGEKGDEGEDDLVLDARWGVHLNG
jgi:hypothetical protein